MSQKKLKVAIIGTGNIGSDLLIKTLRSPFLECTYFIGQNSSSQGIKKAHQLGVRVSTHSIQTIIGDPDCCDLVFDATSASVHQMHAPILKDLGKFTIDLTPSRVGKLCIPLINLEESLKSKNVNMITCGGQATTPIIKAIKNIYPIIEYVEIVSAISSKSAGIGTRNNIDEYTQTTADAIKKFTGISKAKAIIILNPAEPPINMSNTIYLEIGNCDIAKLLSILKKTEREFQTFIPGYSINLQPLVSKGRLVLMNKVIGQGDFLPSFAGNLDIITCAAIKVAEEYAKKKYI